MPRSGYAIKGGLGCNNIIAYEQEIKILLLLGYYITARPSEIPPKQVVIVMSLYFFSNPGWSDEVGPRAVWTLAATPPNVSRRPATIRAELPRPCAEGQIEKRWRNASSG